MPRTANGSPAAGPTSVSSSGQASSRYSTVPILDSFGSVMVVISALCEVVFVALWFWSIHG